jgi:hypothetical protein
LGVRMLLKKEVLHNLLARPCFRRVWVVQEFVLAQEVQPLDGGWSLPYARF